MPTFLKNSKVKKLLLAALILVGCNDSDNVEKIKSEISKKVPVFLVEETKSRLLVNDSEMYEFEKISEKQALEFRVKALEDSMVILKNLTELFLRSKLNREKDIPAFDSMNQSTVELKKLIARYSFMVDSNNTATVEKRKRLDSISSIVSKGSNSKDYYHTRFKICHFNVTAGSTCDSVAFLVDKKLNIISMHIVH